MTKPPKVIPELVRSYKLEPTTYNITDLDTILYALGIGFSTDPMCEEDFKFTYELADGFTTFPTVSTVTNRFDLFKGLLNNPGLPRFNPMMLLHGEQTTECFSPLPTSGKIINVPKVEDIQDKGKGALLIVSQSTVDAETKELYAKNTMRIFIRGIGGFGDKGKVPSLKFPKIPASREPTAEFQFKTRPDQAILYRLNGDRNPLHISPDMAAMGNFERPILHGLCFYGISARAVYEKFCKGDVKNFKKFSARFTSHVFPGETLIIKMYKTGPGTLYVEARTKERGKVVLVGLANYNDATPKL